MKSDEMEAYNDNLIRYSEIVKGKNKDPEIILNCIFVFEGFEDYEKCEHLLKILKEIRSIKS